MAGKIDVDFALNVLMIFEDRRERFMQPIEIVARAIFDAEDTQSGDSVGTVIWLSEHLYYDETALGDDPKERAWIACRPTCIDAAKAALTAIEGAGYQIIPPEQAS